MAICVFDVFPDGTATVPGDFHLTGPGTFRWWHFDLSDPDLAIWAQKNLPEIPAKSLLQSETRPRCDEFDTGLILNLRGINLNAGQPADQMVSVRIWAASQVLVTVRVRKVFALDEIRQAILDGHPPLEVAGFLGQLTYILTKRVQVHVLDLAALTDDFEESIEEDTGQLPASFGETRRSVIKLRRYLEPQRNALHQLATLDVSFIAEKDKLTLRELSNRSTLAVEELDALRDRMATLQAHHDSVVAARHGHNGYVLSAVAAIFLPLGFLTGLFGVNVAGMPGIESPFAFAVLCISMALLAALMVWFMRWKHWL
ncbi:MAG: zinc transporter ZntB [Sulfitobacter sp.]